MIRPVSRIAHPKQMHPTPGLSSPAEDNRAVRDRSPVPLREATNGTQTAWSAPTGREAPHSRLSRTAPPWVRLPDRLGVTGGARGATQPAPQDSHSICLSAARRAALPRAAPPTTRLLPGCECRQGIRHPVHPTVSQIRHDERHQALVEGERRQHAIARRDGRNGGGYSPSRPDVLPRPGPDPSRNAGSG